MAKETISQTEGLCKEVANCIRNAYDRGYKQGFADGQKEKPQVIYEMKKEEYECGLNDAWGTAITIYYMTASQLIDIFGRVGGWVDYSASEAINKIQEYEKKGKRQDLVSIAKDMAQTMAEKLTNEQTAENFVEWFRTNIGGGEKQ